MLGWVFSAIGVVLVVALVAGFFIRLPKVIISPGSATPLDSSVVQVQGAQTYPETSGNVLFLTVRVSTTEPNVWGVVAAWLDDDRSVEDRDVVQGCLSDAQNAQFNTDLMDQSQQDAKYVALTRLGYAVPANPLQVRVIEVCNGTPAAGHLDVGDQILAVDGSPITSGSQVAQLVQTHRPGDPIKITYDRNGTDHTTTITAGKASADRTKCVPANGSTSGLTCVGVSTQGFTTYQFPINVTINTQLVGGPSAGLAFTLAIIDDLTPGSLTGGKRVAITGTIAPDGTVGEVGGVEQKAITARTNGVQLMIVPEQEVKDARRGAGDVRVVGVHDLDGALAALHAAGGAEVPPPSTTAARS
jgi:PDZ domain-containing protein